VTGALKGVRYGSPQKDIIVLVVKSPGWTEVLDVDRSPRWWTGLKVLDVDTRVRWLDMKSGLQTHRLDEDT